MVTGNENFVLREHIKLSFFELLLSPTTRKKHEKIQLFINETSDKKRNIKT